MKCVRDIPGNEHHKCTHCAQRTPNHKNKPNRLYLDESECVCVSITNIRPKSINNGLTILCHAAVVTFTITVLSNNEERITSHWIHRTKMNAILRNSQFFSSESFCDCERFIPHYLFINYSFLNTVHPCDNGEPRRERKMEKMSL